MTIKHQRLEKINTDKFSFAHESEFYFTELLSLYGIKWIYEPISFPLKWGRDGAIKMMFTPDFYLPDHNLFLEITTMNQKLVTKKNKKIKLAKKLFPNVRFKIIYEYQYLDLLNKYKGTELLEFEKAIAS